MRSLLLIDLIDHARKIDNTQDLCQDGFPFFGGEGILIRFVSLLHAVPFTYAAEMLLDRRGIVAAPRAYDQAFCLQWRGIGQR